MVIRILAVPDSLLLHEFVWRLIYQYRLSLSAAPKAADSNRPARPSTSEAFGMSAGQTQRMKNKGVPDDKVENSTEAAARNYLSGDLLSLVKMEVFLGTKHRDNSLASIPGAPFG